MPVVRQGLFFSTTIERCAEAGRKKAVLQPAILLGRAGRPAFAQPKCGAQGERNRITNPFTAGFDSPTIAVRENGTYGGQGKAAGFSWSGGFAV